jgi:hypothetical protein
LRRRGAIPGQAGISIAGRIAPLSLTLWLFVHALLGVPAVVFAAPPDSNATHAETTSPGPLGASMSSVRRRGLEAPVQLLQPHVEEPKPEVENGDGPPPKPKSAPNDDKQKGSSDERASSRQQRGIRVWPMRANTYTFTQPFGCVPQIANFYAPGDGCPPDRPVIHTGIDLAAPEGTPFYAAAAGWVTDSGYDREVGVPNTRIIIQHVDRNEGYSTVYLHWVASYVKPGDFVKAGEMIGEVGNVGYSTGPHLHFEVVDLKTGENIDPVGWLPDNPGTQGYRGIAPNSRAQMRLPAGTTAGLPETADPAPPSPPKREHVPDTPSDGNGGKKSGHKHDRRHEEKRTARKSATADDTTAATPTAESTDDNSTDATKHEGKNRERSHKRERHKDGTTSKDAANGAAGDQGSADDGSADDSTRDSSRKAKHDNRGGHHNRSADGHNANQRKTDHDRNDHDKGINNDHNSDTSNDKVNGRGRSGDGAGSVGNSSESNDGETPTDAIAANPPADARDPATSERAASDETSATENSRHHKESD